MNAQNSSGQNKQSKINIVLRSVFDLQKPHFGWLFMHIFVESMSNVVDLQGHEAKLLGFQTRIPIVILEKNFGWKRRQHRNAEKQFEPHSFKNFHFLYLLLRFRQNNLWTYRNTPARLVPYMMRPNSAIAVGSICLMSEKIRLFQQMEPHKYQSSNNKFVLSYLNFKTLMLDRFNCIPKNF